MMQDDPYLIVAVEESDSSVGFYDPENGKELGRIDVGFWPHEIEVDPDGKTAYVANFGVKDYDERIGRPGASISVIDLATFTEKDRLFTFGHPYEYGENTAPHGVKLAPNGDLYVNVENGGKLLVYDLLSPSAFSPKRSLAFTEEGPSAQEFAAPDQAFPLPEGTHNFVFNASGDILYIVSGKGGITAIDPLTGKTLFARKFDSAVRGLVFSPDGQELIASLSNTLLLLNPANLETNRSFGKLGVGQILYSKPGLPDKDGRYEIIAPAVWESQILFVDSATGNVTGRVLTGLDPIHLQLSPDGKLVYVTHGRSKYISVIDVAARRIKFQIPTRGGPNGIALARRFPPARRLTLRLGACLPLSGGNSTEGREIRLGYEYWKEQVNAAGGILVGDVPYMVEVLYRDHAGDLDRVASLTEELVADRATILLGTYPSPFHVPCRVVAEAHHIPFIIATGAGTEIYGHPFTFGIMSPARLYLEGTVEVVKAHLPNARLTVALLGCDDFAAFEDARMTAIFAYRSGFEVVSPAGDLPPPFVRVPVDAGDGVTVEIVRYPHNHTSFEEVLKHYQELSLDLFLSTGHLNEATAMAIQAGKNPAFAPRAFGFSVGPPLTTFRAKVAEGGVSPAYLFGAAQWTERLRLAGHDRHITPAEFARAFFERFSLKASYFSAGGYACGLVIERALAAAGTVDSAALRDAIAGLKIDTFFAHIEFDEKGLNSSKPMYTIQLKPGDQGLEEVVLWPVQGATWPRPSNPQSTPRHG